MDLCLGLTKNKLYNTVYLNKIFRVTLNLLSFIVFSKSWYYFKASYFDYKKLALQLKLLFVTVNY